MRFRNVLYGVALLAALGGCADQATVNQPTTGVTMPATPPAWREPASYKFTLKSTCGTTPLQGTFQTAVQNGVVVAQTALDAPARQALMLRQSRLVPTLGEIEATAESARKNGADEVVIDHDKTDGHPVSVRIDPQTDKRGDETCLEISDYSAG